MVRSIKRAASPCSQCFEKCPLSWQGVFAADNLLKLWERLAPEERETYPFAMHQIKWQDYLWNTHLPGIRR